MQKYTNVFQDTLGRIITGATVTVTVNGSGAAATLYSDNGVTQLPNNTTTTDTLGQFYFYAADGRYDVALSKTGVTSETLRDILLFDPAASTGSAGVGTIQSGTGAVATTLQARDRQIYYATDFAANGVSGAAVVGDGSTDCTGGFAAIGLAVYNAGGGTVIVPPGTYMLDYLDVYPLVSWVGHGKGTSILKRRTSSTTGHFVRPKSGLGIVDFQGQAFTGFLINANSVGTDLDGINFLDYGASTNNFAMASNFDFTNNLVWKASGRGVAVGFNVGEMKSINTLWCKQGIYIQGVVANCYGLSSGGSVNEEVIINCDNCTIYGLETEYSVAGKRTDDATRAVVNIINHGKVAIHNLYENAGASVRKSVVATNGNPYVQIHNLNRAVVGFPTHGIDDNGTFYDDQVIPYWTNGTVFPGTLKVAGATTLTGATATNALTAGGLITANAAVVATKAYTSSTITSCPNNTATTIYTVASLEMGLFVAWLDSNNANIMAAAMVGIDNTNAGLLALANNGLIALSKSGNNIQVTQTSGVTANVRYSFLRLWA